jgi:hypothetical protein
VLPGALNTRIVNWRGALDYFVGPDKGIQAMAEGLHYSNPLRGQSFVPLEQLSNAMLFFASDESANVTGVDLPVESGGLLLPGHNFHPIMDLGRPGFGPALTDSQPLGAPAT